MVSSFPSPLWMYDRVTTVAFLHIFGKEPPSKKRRVEGHPLLFLAHGKARWLALPELHPTFTRAVVK